jgi:predicted RNase H-like HicB family nuclease
VIADSIRYEIILYWSKEDQAFIAEVPELPGCAADGATYQDALANAEVIIREWIETARAGVTGAGATRQADVRLTEHRAEGAPDS